MAATQAKRRGERGPARKPTKRLISLRIDPEVIAKFKATGPGWQARMNEALKAVNPTEGQNNGQ